jgi:hypothetical protein
VKRVARADPAVKVRSKATATRERRFMKWSLTTFRRF